MFCFIAYHNRPHLSKHENHCYFQNLKSWTKKKLNKHIQVTTASQEMKAFERHSAVSLAAKLDLRKKQRKLISFQLVQLHDSIIQKDAHGLTNSTIQRTHSPLKTVILSFEKFIQQFFIAQVLLPIYWQLKDGSWSLEYSRKIPSVANEVAQSWVPNFVSRYSG